MTDRRIDKLRGPIVTSFDSGGSDIPCMTFGRYDDKGCLHITDTLHGDAARYIYELERKLGVAIEALKFYAKQPNNYKSGIGQQNIPPDCGKVAAKALAQIETKDNKGVDDGS